MELSLVIPVYNSGQTIADVVGEIHQEFVNKSFEVILVNDGSHDDSERVCSQLVHDHPQTTRFVQLARNFGEHGAVLAGLCHARGQCVAVLDDDGQNPPREVARMLDHLREQKLDVVYGRYVDRKHSWFRRWGSWLNDYMATKLLKKPKELYFSSFKVMNRFVVDEIKKYAGPFPYIDGLIYRTTTNLGQIDVEHRQRAAGQSGYTIRRLVRLWLNMFLGFSIIPLRLAVVFGFLASLLSVVGLVAIVIDKLWVNPDVPVGIPTVLICIVLFAGIQLMVLGMVGEYVGRVFLHQSGMPQFVVRYSIDGQQRDD